jgi:hypothetical protein
MAQFYTDFSAHAVASGVPTGWTKRQGANAQVSIVDGGQSGGDNNSGGTWAPTGNRMLKVVYSPLTSEQNILTYDTPGSPAIFDIIAKVGVQSVTNDQIGVMARSTGSDRDYSGHIGRTGGSLIRFRVAGTSYDTAYAHTAHKWYFVRYRSNGTNVQGTVSDTLANVTGTTPAAGWFTSVTDPAPSLTGYVGLHINEQNGYKLCDWIGVGTAGDAAPTAAVSGGTPLATPTGFTFVKGTNIRQVTAAWSTVSGAATYDIQVERWTGSEWTAFYTGNQAGLSLVLDDDDGVNWSTLYRARVRAVPA